MSALRGLLWCGVVGPVLFIVLFLVNDAIKPGYDPVRDAVSEAAIGSGGWLQCANFIVSGLLIAASSAAITRIVGRWAGALVGVTGAGLALAGVFVSDPVPTGQASWHGMIHNVAGTASSAARLTLALVLPRGRCLRTADLRRRPRSGRDSRHLAAPQQRHRVDLAGRGGAARARRRQTAGRSARACLRRASAY